VAAFMQSGLLDGVILMQVQLCDPRIETLKRSGIPFVLIGRCLDNTGLTFIDLDIDLAITQCVEHLTALGHRLLAYLCLDDPDLGFSARANRAYAAACGRSQLPLVTPTCDLTVESGAQVTAALLAERPETTALIVWNDLAAWGALQTLQALGRRVPEDVSLICFDLSTVANVVPLRPTVVDIRPREMAAEAARMLLAQLNASAPAQAQVLLEPKLVIGETTAPAPGRSAP